MTVRLFDISGTIKAVALHISKAFDWAQHASPLHKFKSYEILG